ncbi:MAG TPA: ABC transporter permease [Candidatus Ozemobacteraceae bacterium]|nr:ABC transporter permease [Candidatus Ozemobacteraceae bacterium]
MTLNFMRFRAVARKEFLHVIRDPRSLGLAIALPMFMMLLFGYALSLDVDRVGLLVYDRCGTPRSRELLSKFNSSRYFKLVRQISTDAEIGQAFDRNEAMIALSIPVTFDRDLGAGRPVTVQIIADGSDANTATIALGYGEAIIAGFSGEITLERIRRQGRRPPETPVEVRPRAWYNPDMESRLFIIPGVMAVVLMIIAGLLTPLSVAREWETGTMEQLISTPVSPAELVLGKLAPYFSIGMFDVLLTLFAGQYLFDVPMRGSPVLLLATAAVYLSAGLGLGMVLSIVTRNQLLASQAAMVSTFLPAMMLSGFISPISQMPDPVQVITRLFPARYFVTVLKGIQLKGLGFTGLHAEIGFLLLFAGVLIVAAISAFRKNLE